MPTASLLLKGLKDDLFKFRVSEFENIYERAKDLCNKLNILPEFSAKRKIKIKKLFSYEAEDEGNQFSEKDNFKINFLEVLDNIYNQIDWRFKNLDAINKDFDFLFGHSLINKSDVDLRKDVHDFSVKYGRDIDPSEVLVSNLKGSHAEKLSPLEIFQLIIDYKLIGSYPNMSICYRIFLSIPATSASCERSFSKLKLIKSYLRSSMGQERLSSLALISIESSMVNSLNFEELIDNFANAKARRVHF